MPGIQDRDWLLELSKTSLIFQSITEEYYVPSSMTLTCCYILKQQCNQQPSLSAKLGTFGVLSCLSTEKTKQVFVKKIIIVLIVEIVAAMSC